MLCIAKLIKINYLESNYNILSIAVELNGALLKIYRYDFKVT